MKQMVSALDNKSYQVIEASDLYSFYEQSKDIVPLDLNDYWFADGSGYNVKKYLNDVDDYCEDRITQEGDTLDMLVSLTPVSHETQEYMRVQSNMFELRKTVPYMKGANDSLVWTSKVPLSEFQYRDWYQDFGKALQTELSGSPVKAVEKESEMSEWAMLLMSTSLVKPVKNQPGIVSANIGFNNEHGQYGRMFFSDTSLKASREHENVAFLPLRTDGSYKVVCGNSKEDRHVETMTGKQIIERNQEYQKEQRASRASRAANMDMMMDNMTEIKSIQATPALSGKDAESVILQTNTMPTKEAMARNQMLSNVLKKIRE